MNAPTLLRESFAAGVCGTGHTTLAALLARVTSYKRSWRTKMRHKPMGDLGRQRLTLTGTKKCEQLIWDFSFQRNP